MRRVQLLLCAPAVVFTIALCAPGSALADVAFEDYQQDGLGLQLASLECATAACGDGVDCGTHCGAATPGLLAGCKAHLRDSGILFQGNVTQFGFGVDGGINVPVAAPFDQGDTFEYTGRGEYNFLFDLEKFGGLPHGKLLIGVQHWWGEYANISTNTGTFAPPVFPAALPTTPDNPGVPYVTDFLITQPLSERLILFAGKKNVIGSADQDIFAGGDGTDQFVNQALVANPAFLLALPYSSFTAGVAMPRDWGAMSLYVYDATDRTRDFFRFNRLFGDGIIVGGQVGLNTRFFDKPGEHHVGALWKHLDLPDLSFSPPAPEYPYPPVVPGVPSIRDSYTIYYGFDQYLKVLPGERQVGPAMKPRGFGLFGRASISDSNPTPINYFLSLGIGGDSPLRQGSGDAFGIGWFFIGASDEFSAASRTVFGPRDGTGVELYYNFKLTRSINVTPDVQYIRPGLGRLTSGDDAFVYGVRVNLRL